MWAAPAGILVWRGMARRKLGWLGPVAGQGGISRARDSWAPAARALGRRTHPEREATLPEELKQPTENQPTREQEPVRVSHEAQEAASTSRSANLRRSPQTHF